MPFHAAAANDECNMELASECEQVGMPEVDLLSTFNQSGQQEPQQPPQQPEQRLP